MDTLRQAISLGLEYPVLHVTRVVDPAQVIWVIVVTIAVDVISKELVFTVQLNHDNATDFMCLASPFACPVALPLPANPATRSATRAAIAGPHQARRRGGVNNNGIE